MQASSPSAALSSRLAGTVAAWNQRYWRFLVIAMLALLHVAALRGTADGWARALLLAHLGLLLLWQPFLRTENRIGVAQTAFIALVAIGVMLWLSWWLLAFWVVVLAGLVGGRVYLHRAKWQRWYYLVVLGYLLALLAVVILPEIAPRREIAPEVLRATEYGLPLLFVVLALIPAEAESPHAPQVIDFFYSVFLMMLLGMVVLGSFTFMTLDRTSYLQALTDTVFLIAGAILAIGLAWDPRGGFSGLSVFFSRYLFSIGMPVEKWLHFLADLFQSEARPERFVAEGAAGLLQLPWVAGASWRAGDDSGEVGARSNYPVQHQSGKLSLTVYSHYRVGPALQWHLHLLGQLLGEFYAAKLREQELRQASYMQAVHETGARVTHDVKNLLQSLNVLCSAVAAEPERDPPQLQALIRRQLPLIAQRLNTTLARLERPETEAALQVPAREWWDALVRQYQGQGVEFACERVGEGEAVPRVLFDGVVGNLLQNAIAKRAGSGALRIRVTLSGGSAMELRVCDSGRAVPPDQEKLLLRTPVQSAAGLGIGLFQAARHAESNGYRLLLASNRDGEVCFALRRAA